MRKRVNTILCALFAISFFAPFFLLKKHHNCEFYDDECMMIYYKGDIGICIESAIDDLCFTFSILWFWLSLMAGMMGSSKRCESLFSASYALCLAIVGFSIFMSLLDPSKWAFTLSLIISLVILTIIIIVENKIENQPPE